MIVRGIRKEEVKRAQELSALAFEWSFDGDRPAIEVYEKAAAEPGDRIDQDWRCYIAAFDDDDRTMMSMMCVIPYTVRFDGHWADMRGIGNVCTLPMYRRHGGIRACFEKALPQMYETGAVFSYLYPFSTAFYRRFGYELGCEGFRLKLRTEAIPKWDLGGRWALAEASAPLAEDIRAVYDAFAGRHNLMTKDDWDVDYAWLKKLNPFKDKEYTYVYYGACGAAKGYLTVKLVNEKADRNLNCIRFAFADPEGFKGLLALLKTFQSDHPTATFALPADTPWQPLIPEHSQGMAEWTSTWSGMVRVVNVRRALELARPRGTGEVTLEIRDAQIPENNARFEARFEDGRMLRVERTEREPMLSMGVNDFSSLILGKYDVDALPYMAGVRVNCDPAEAAKLFYKKPMHIARPF